VVEIRPQSVFDVKECRGEPMKQMTSNSMQVEDEFVSVDGKVKLPGAKVGTWKVISVGQSKMYLHSSLSVEVASSLALWEDVEGFTDTVKLTRDIDGLIVGVAIRK